MYSLVCGFFLTIYADMHKSTWRHVSNIEGATRKIRRAVVPIAFEYEVSSYVHV